jgi:hypothetical protein
MPCCLLKAQGIMKTNSNIFKLERIVLQTSKCLSFCSNIINTQSIFQFQHYQYPINLVSLFCCFYPFHPVVLDRGMLVNIFNLCLTENQPTSFQHRVFFFNSKFVMKLMDLRLEEERSIISLWKQYF